jgi:hypothetical protein
MKGSNVSSDCGFSAFIRSDRYGMPAWADHVRSWLPNADVVVRYEDLKVDSATVVGSALSRLGVGETIENSVIQEAARRSAFDQMKKIEEKHGRPLQDEFDKNFRFVRKGTSGGWKREFKDDDRKYVEEFVESRFGHKYEKIEPNIQ